MKYLLILVILFLKVVVAQNITLDDNLLNQIKNSGLSANQLKQIATQKGIKIDSDSFNDLENSFNDLENKNESDLISNQDIENDVKNIINLDKSNNFDKISENGISMSEIPISKKVADKVKEKKSKDVEIALKKISKKGSYFGYNVFKGNPEVYQNSAFSFLDPNYLIGPGDDIVVMLWGETEINKTYKISKDGYLFISDIGRIFVNGLNLEKLESKLFKLLTNVYSSLDNSNGQAKTFFDLSIGSSSLRPLRVFVLGETSNPGAYDLKQSSTVFSSLFYFDGPTLEGSLRDIQLIRNEKNIGSIDFYAYLLEGKKINDLRLQRDDVIFIPKRKNTIKTVGEINRNLFFEINKDETLIDLINIAGGIKPTTYLGRVKIDRILPKNLRDDELYSRTTIDVDLKDILDLEITFNLHDGDVVTFFKIDDTFDNVVQIEGSVKRPGQYDLSNGLKLTDLILKADSLLGDAYLQRADITRFNKDRTESLIIVDLGKAMNNDTNENIELQSRDAVKIYNIDEMEFKAGLTIEGHVKSPGLKPFFKDITVKDLLNLGGGFEDSAHVNNTFFKRADLIFTDTQGLDSELIKFRLDSVLAGKGIANKKLKMGSKIKVYSYSEIYGIPPNSVVISGHVKKPGTYQLIKDFKILDLLFFAGGFEEKSHLSNTFMDRFDVYRINEKDLTRDKISYSLKEILKNQDELLNFNLLAGDQVVIFSKESFISIPSVSISGEIKNPGEYDFKNNMTLSDLILEAGGVDFDIKNFRADILTMNSSQPSEGFEKFFTNKSYTVKNSMDILRGKLAINNVMLKPFDEVIIRKQLKNDDFFVEVNGQVLYPGSYHLLHNQEQVYDIIKRAGGLLKTSNPLSSKLVRDDEIIKLSFVKILKNPKSKHNFVLLPGDEITINQKTNLIKIVGEVNNPGNYQYLKGYKFLDYIKIAGGYSKDASKYNSFVTHADGSSEQLRYLRSPKIFDGSLINVASKEQVEPFSFTEYVTNLTAIYTDLIQAYAIISVLGRSN